MSYVATPDDIEFDAPSKVEPAAVATRRDLAQVEHTLSEFDKVSAGLDVLRKEHPVDLVFDVTTTKGMAEAKAHRAAWRDPRITVEKCRKAGKAPVLALGKNIDARAAWLTEQLLLGETPVDEQIKAEESRQAQIKADKEAAEFGRVLAIQEAIGEISMLAMTNGLPSVAIAARIESLLGDALDPKVFQELMPQAQAARTAALSKLEQALKAAQWDEAEAKRKADEAERARVEQAAADAERARVSAAQAEEAKRLQEARDMIAKAEREAAQCIADERAAFERERAEFMAAQEAAKPAPIIEPVAAPVIAPPACFVPIEPQKPAAVVDQPATVSTGTICQRLGFVLTVDFIVHTLGVPAAKTDKRAMLWTESDFQRITRALVDHVERIGSEVATA